MRRDTYTETLKKAGAVIVLSNVQKLTAEQIQELVS